MAKRTRRRVRRTPRSRRHPYRFRSYGHDLQQAIARLLELPAVLTPVRRGGWTPVLTLLAGLLMSYSRAATLTARFQEAAAALRKTCRGLSVRSYQGWAKALRQQAGLVQVLAAALRPRILDLAARPELPGQQDPRTGPWCLLAAEGSRLNLPRTRACRRWSPVAGKKGTAPQLYLTCLYHVATGLVWDYRIGKGTASEREHLQAMLAHLPPQPLLLADAGFVGYPLLEKLQRQGIAFLVRAGANVHVLTGLGLQVQEAPDRVYLWPAQVRTRRRRALALRQIVLKHRGRTMALLTNVGSLALPRALARRLYALRWGVEVFYRHLKQKLEKRTLQSTSPAMAVLELHLAVRALNVAGLLAWQAWPHRRGPLPLAGILEVLRQAVGCPRVRTWTAWRRVLGRCRPDPYLRRRTRRKRAWPDRKHDRPCGLPHLRAATATERRCAQQLTPLLLAA